MALLTLSMSASTASAVDDPAAVKVGETDLVPELHLEYFSNDNAYYEETGGESSNGVLLAPTLSWTANQRTLQLEAKYEGRYSREDADNQDYTDHSLSFRATGDINKRLRTDARLRVLRGHQDPSDYLSDRTASQLTDILEFDRLVFNTYLTYGARGALANMRFGLAYYDTDFQTTADGTTRTDRSSLSPEIRFSLRVSPDTRAFVLARYAQTDYAESRLDRNRVTTEAGLLWEITEKTAGALSIGVSSWDFPNIPGLDDKTTVARLTGTYSPTGANQLEFNASRSLNDDDSDSEEQVISDNLELAWRYDWNDRFFHRASFSLEDIDRGACPEQGQRLNETELALNYKFRRWLVFGGKFAVQENVVEECDGFTISDAINDYDKQTFGLFIEASL